mmetsp:Transcript_2944/g.7771  ORF Transcript_2944/g.7771 Transcript_2944/m.7771 type:complete len:317 (+) Transcript_2944:42-992(+)
MGAHRFVMGARESVVVPEASRRELSEAVLAVAEVPEVSRRKLDAAERAVVEAPEGFRNYESSERQALVERTYMLQHVNQTFDFVQSRHSKWLNFDRAEMTILEAIELLDGLVDDSDPDTALPNSIHDFQTAERIRADFPGEEHDWFHLVGLLHDVGKICALWGEQQWAAVGDTFAVGCKFSDKIVFAEQMRLNADSQHPVYSTEHGIYRPGCGINELTLSWGHDEYMYRVLVNAGCTIPAAGLAMVRFHSFYPWHTGGSYMEFMNSESDEELLKWVRVFNRYDLYSKSDAVPDVEALKPYYQGLLQKYRIGGIVKF